MQGWWLTEPLLCISGGILQFEVNNKKSGGCTFAQDCVTPSCQMPNEVVCLRSTLIRLVRDVIFGFPFSFGRDLLPAGEI